MTYSFTILKSNRFFIFLCCVVITGLFLKSGFTSISVIVFFLYCLITHEQTWAGQLKKHWLLFIPILLFLFFLLSALFVRDQDSINLILRKAPLLFLPLGFAVSGRKISSAEFNIVLFTLLIVCLAASVICFSVALYNIISHGTYIVITPDREYYYFSYMYLAEPVGVLPIYLSMFCNLAFAIVLMTSFIEKYWARIIIGIYLAFFVIMLSSKIGIVTLVLILVYWLMISRFQGKLPYILLIGAILAIPIGIYKLPFLKDRFTTSLAFDYKQEYGHLWNSTAYRMAIWSSALETISENPVWGYGTGKGQKALEEKYKEHGFVWGLRDSLNPHNEFLSTILDTGIIGVIVALSMVFIPLGIGISKKDLLVVSFFLVTLFFFSTESVLVRQKGIVFFAFFYSFLLWNLKQNNDTKDELA